MRFLACLLVAAAIGLNAAEERPAAWAVPIASDQVRNFFQVAPGLYHSAQPDAAGMRAIEAMGIRTVVNLRAFHNDGAELAGTGLLSDELSVKTWHLEDEDVIRVLRLARDPTKGPILIHCQHGSDRTGTMCAMYRIVIQGWSREDAIREMTEGGYGFWSGWTNLVTYLRKVDVEAIRAAVDAP